ncbi:MAG: hypothetical protein AAGF82_14075, partial [Pseudomonadota bacterium]
MAKYLRLRSGVAPLILFVALAFSLPASAQATYLNDKTSFDIAWTTLSNEIGDSDLLWLRVEPDSFSVIAATGRDGEEFNLWSVRRDSRDPGSVDKLHGPMHMADGPKF